MSVTLYHFPKSAPSRTALLVARSLDLDIDVQIVNLPTKEQLKPEYIKVRKQFNKVRLCLVDLIVCVMDP